MEVIYYALLDVYKEIEEEIDKEGKAYCFYYVKEVVGSLTKYNGSIEEYMQVARVSSSLPLATTLSFIGIGEMITKEAFDWVYNNPFTVASCLIARLMNDKTTHKIEQERGHVASTIECYVKQYSVSKQQDYDEFNKQIVNVWKEINQGFLIPTSMPIPILIGVLNHTRDTHVGKVMKDNIASLLIDPALV